MRVVAGLGNPGERYEGTRHNIGFRVVEQVAASGGAGDWRRQHESLVADVMVGGEKVLLLKPLTFMNRSGQAVRRVLDFHKLPVESLLVVCDDLNLPLAKLRMRAKGSAGGQNGLKDIIAQLGTDGFARLRIGIGEVPERMDAADFVLSAFRPGEREQVADAVIEAGSAVECWCREGVEIAMTRHNAKDKKG